MKFEIDSPNQADPVNAPIAPWFQFEQLSRRVTELWVRFLSAERDETEKLFTTDDADYADDANVLSVQSVSSVVTFPGRVLW